jgi:hypothetical protein
MATLKKNINLTFKNMDNLSEMETEEQLHPLLPKQNNFRMLVIGGSGTGKTNMVVQYIIRFMKIDRLYVCSKHLQQDKMVYLHKHFTELENAVNRKLKVKKKPENFKIIMTWASDLDSFPLVDELDPAYKNVVLFDDLVCEIDKKDKIGNYYIRSRHKNCSIFYLAQSFFMIPRKVRLNTTLFSLFGLPSLTEVNRIWREVASDLTKTEFLEYFKEAIGEEDSYGFFFINTLEKKKFLKYRSGLDGLLIEPKEPNKKVKSEDSD